MSKSFLFVYSLFGGCRTICTTAAIQCVRRSPYNLYYGCRYVRISP